MMLFESSIIHLAALNPMKLIHAVVLTDAGTRPTLSIHTAACIFV
jgi:hypothetical protein